MEKLRSFSAGPSVRCLVPILILSCRGTVDPFEESSGSFIRMDTVFFPLCTFHLCAHIDPLAHECLIIGLHPQRRATPTRARFVQLSRCKVSEKSWTAVMQFLLDFADKWTYAAQAGEGRRSLLGYRVVFGVVVALSLR